MIDSDIELELEAALEPNQSEKFNLSNLNTRFAPYRLNNNMANANAPQTPLLIPFQINELCALIKSLPDFYPESNLSTFITSVDNLATFLASKLTPTQTYLFNVSILSKIKNEARDYLNIHNETEWPGIRNTLLRKYGDQRNEELLISALRNTIQTKNENYNDYYDKILLAQNDLLQYVQLHENDANMFTYKKIYQKQSLHIFCSGLLEPYRTYLMNFDLISLEDALNKCRIYNNKIKENKFTDYVRRLQNSKSQRPPPQTYRPTNNPTQFQSKPFQPHPTQFQPHPTQFQPHPKPFEPRPFLGPINKPIQQQLRFPTNKQVFGTKPGNQIHQVPYKPTPMSVQTSAYFNNPKFNPSQPTNRPNFISEELFNTEIGSEDYFENNVYVNESLEDNTYEYYNKNEEKTEFYI